MKCRICDIERSVHDDHRDCVMLLRNRVAELEAEVSALREVVEAARTHAGGCCGCCEGVTFLREALAKLDGKEKP